MNFYRADQSLRDLLALYLPDDLRAHLEPHLDRLGGLAAGELDECAALADNIRRSCIIATDSDATGNGSNTIRRIGGSRRSRTANSASTR